MSISDSTSFSSTSLKNSTLKVLPHQCRICGAPANYSYYGVISCYSCKIFFRRNGNCTKLLSKCVFAGECEININNRHICTTCRLTKCFICGMTTDKFRPSRQIKPKTLVKVQHQPERLPTRNLLQSDLSILTTTQWTLISNLSNGYKESNLVSIGQRLIDTHTILQSTDLIYQALIEEFSACIYKTTGTYLRSNNDLCNLPSNDRSIILHSAADNICCMIGAFAIYQCHLLNFVAFSNAMKTMCEKRTVDIHLRAMKFIDPDAVIIKLALALFTVSENICLYSSNVSTDLRNSLLILEIQNKYAELTWKYLLYKYGHHEAVRRFLNLICWFEAMNSLILHAGSFTTHVNDINSLVEQTEHALMLDDIDRITETN